MRKYEIVFCFFCIGLVNCKGQDGKVDALKMTAGSTFEEKQKIDLSKQKLETVYTSSNYNFRYAAKKATPGVVHITSTYSNDAQLEFLRQFDDDFWYRYFSEGNLEKPKSDASGVIISSDGYIVTNDHVVEDAELIEVQLENQKIYKARIVGIDAETDLALLKIDEKDLAFIEFGNSDDVEVGDWVLAVGNPFNLTSTVTAGIVSAKARDINILKRKGAVESYIQTDAAVNPGNSGGALVDFDGKLIGINSAIATPTGAYAGYSFATPVNIVKKIINDLLLTGKVNRGYLGLVLKNMTNDEAKQLNTDISIGVYVDSVIKGGAAMEADMKKNDIIVAIDEYKISRASQLREIIERHHPGEKIILTIIRDGKERKMPIILKEYDGATPKIVVDKTEVLKKLGITIEELSEKEKKKMKLKNGVKVVDISKGKIYSYTNIKKGFVITKVNGKPVGTKEEFIAALENQKGGVMLEGVYPNFPVVYYYAFGIE